MTMFGRDENDGYIEVFLKRNNTQVVDVPSLASEYSIRSYQAGDEKNWFELFSQNFLANIVDINIFSEYFSAGKELLKQRQFYLYQEDENNVVATATAWFNDNYRDQVEPIGRLHWVAVHPKCQKEGLGRFIVSYACRKLVDCGYKYSYLRTYSFRLSAIELYLSIGFQPEIFNDQDEKIWREIYLRTQNKFLSFLFK